MSLRRWGQRLLLLVGGALASVVVAEIAARVLAPPGGAHLLFNGPDGEPDNLVQPDQELRTALRPGFTGTVRLPGVNVDLRVNALGFRGEEPPAQAGRARWIAIGDSFTFAAQVSEEDTFAAQLGARIGADVFNAGVDGDSTWQSARRYLRVEPAIAPDGVVLVYFLGNDPLDNERFAPTPPPAEPRPAVAGPLATAPRPRLTPYEAFLFEHSFLHAHWRVWSRTQRLTGGRGGDLVRWRDEVELYTTRGRGRIQGAMPHTERAFQELAAWTKERGDRLVVALAPPVFAVDPARLAPTLSLVGLDPASGDTTTLHAAVTAVLGRQGIAACDLQAPLRAAQAAGEEPYLHYDGHWSAAGHRVVADALAGCLQ
jgi:hypothetical protein